MKVGFTGTQRGMTDAQARAFTEFLKTFTPSQFHHGQCIGADAQAAVIARNLGWELHAHPGSDTPDKRHLVVSDVVHPELPNLQRNSVLARYDALVACPGEANEVLRSGTWSTIRRARNSRTYLLIIRPDGTT